LIREWNLLRAVACLSIVFLHSTTFAGPTNYQHMDLFRALLCYATPAFIVLSEIILANRYPDKLPDNFWTKRFKWIYLPFLSFAVIDALVGKHFYPNLDVTQKIFENAVFGLFGGYFVLIIFQFYFLHYLVVRFKISMKVLVPLSIVIMYTHLYFLHGDLPFVQEYRRYLIMPFTAWFAYFTVAFVIGKHYQTIAPLLKKYRWYTFIPLLVSIAFVSHNFQDGLTLVNSRRIDLFPVVLSVSLFILAWGQLVPKFRFINLISNYSFGIYLVHGQVMKFLAPHTIFLDNKMVQIFVLFAASLIVSISIIKLFSLVPAGSFVIGNVKRGRKKVVKRQFAESI
jgi:probable poly-beta-1,6-N-acetyl-D-glucosamine export protein